MHAKHPEIAKRWDKETGGKVIPKKAAAKKAAAPKYGASTGVRPGFTAKAKGAGVKRTAVKKGK